MFRIGFDPILEAEQRHEEIIREMERIRMATQRMDIDKPKNHNGVRLLALVGKGMASLGAIIEARYGNQLEPTIGLEQRDISGDCV